ncbi:unnamed protein product [Schistocephalus solidus]|uniref:Uncharacterized protein n=1 Tax=Schistocephalus solidus TaxID=70667 RepID=A0A183TLU9_SCHSO|nr:unnamed protein product [Schistocephalus solidus]
MPGGILLTALANKQHNSYTLGGLKVKAINRKSSLTLCPHPAPLPHLESTKASQPEIFTSLPVTHWYLQGEEGDSWRRKAELARNQDPEAADDAYLQTAPRRRRWRPDSASAAPAPIAELPVPSLA